MVEVSGQASTSGTGGTGGNTIDISNPLYIHPSDNPSLTLVPVAFEGIGYRSWRRGVMRSLSVKNKLRLITGEFKRPSSTSPQYCQWERCDNMVISWILNSLSKDIADSVEYVSDAVELWKELEDRYDQTNGAKLFQIQRDINDLSQGVLDVTVYYTRMKKLWEELSNLSIKNLCSCACSCGGKEIMHKAEQDRRLIQFLMGLNEVYTVIRGNSLMMNPLPSMAQAFALLVQEEKQREFKPHSQMFAEGSSMNSSIRGGSSNPSGGRLNSANTSSSNSTGGRVFRTNYAPSNYPANNRPRPFCEHCKRSGHIIDKCYKLHGYPNQNNSSNGQGVNQNQRVQTNYNAINRYARGKGVVAANVFAESSMGKTDAHTACSANLTNEQCGQLINLLQHIQLGQPEDVDSEEQVTCGAANFAGPFNEEASGDW